MGFMTQTLQRPKTEIVAFIQAMAYDELNRIPGVSPSNSLPKPGRHTEKSTAYIISILKNGQEIGTRKTEATELHNAAIALASVFREKASSYERLVAAAKGMTAKDRCFNLFSSKVAMASIEAGMLEASQNAQMFFKISISALDAVNNKTQVTCEMH